MPRLVSLTVAAAPAAVVAALLKGFLAASTPMHDSLSAVAADLERTLGTLAHGPRTSVPKSVGRRPASASARQAGVHIAKLAPVIALARALLACPAS